MKKIFIKGIIGSLILSAIMAIFVVIFEPEGDWGFKILLTIFTVFPFSITGLCCASIFEKEKIKWFSTIGIIINVLTCLLYISLIWEIFDICLFFCKEDTTFMWQLLGTTTLLSTSTAHISLILLINSKESLVKIVKTITIIISIIVDIIILDSFWFQILKNIEKLTLSLIIIMILITILSPILHVLTKKQTKKEIQDMPKNKCPKCNLELEENWKFCPNCNNEIKSTQKKID